MSENRTCAWVCPGDYLDGRDYSFGSGDLYDRGESDLYKQVIKYVSWVNSIRFINTQFRGTGSSVLIWFIKVVYSACLYPGIWLKIGGLVGRS